jgi:hypothetical protein
VEVSPRQLDRVAAISVPMLITEDSSEGGGFKDGYVEILSIEGIEAAHAAAEGDDPSRQMARAVKAASPNPRGRCGTHRPQWSAAGDGRCDCRWHEGAHELIELVAGEWRASRTGNGDQVVAIFDGHDHGPIGIGGPMIKNYSVRQGTGRQPICAARVGRGDLLPFARDTDAPDVVQPHTKPRSSAHGVDDKISVDASGGRAMAPRQDPYANTPPALVHQSHGITAVQRCDGVD